jgi:hypothetical protein
VGRRAYGRAGPGGLKARPINAHRDLPSNAMDDPNRLQVALEFGGFVRAHLPPVHFAARLPTYWWRFGSA